MSENPTAEPPGAIVGRADFWYTEDEFARAERRVQIANGRSFDGWVVRLPLLVLGHFLLLFGLAVVGVWLGSADFRNREKSTGSMVVALGFLVAGGWIVDRWLYGRGRRLRKRFRDFPLAGCKVELAFTPDRLLTRSAKSEGRTLWELFTGVFESRDGLVLTYPPGQGTWIPKRGLQPPFDAPAVAAFLKSKVGKGRATLAPTDAEPDPATSRHDPPIAADPARVVGSASYRFTADEFAAATWATAIVTVPWYRSRLWGLLYFGFWHAVLIAGLGIVVAWADLRGQGERVSGSTAFFAVMAIYLSALILWAGLYAIDRRIRGSYRTSPLAGDEYAVTFTPERYLIHTRLGEASETWDFLRGVVELRDGFVLRPKLSPGGIWVPDHAIHPPFDHQAAAAFLGSKVGKYRVVDRAARKIAGPV
ncbi:YcxB family protein [Paludisphaera soli]|uniref:YcxB family protein n=1 Tax=Paludisphaera soli TaxID=2712865 RepID=UPI0013EBF0E9|nr:YcxB family protein [Paludisphaera soli]